MSNNYYFYMRISTKEERNKQKYSRQEQALKKYAEKNGIKDEQVLYFKEDASGKNFTGRKEWKNLEAHVTAGDTIVFKDICRFTREAENGCSKYMELMEKGVSLIFLDNPTLNTDYMKNLLKIAEEQDIIARESTKFIAKVLLLTELDRAEKERLYIIQRTKDGMQARKKEAEEKGLEWHVGRKPGTLDKLSEELRADIALYLGDRTIKAADLMRKHKISRNTFKKYCEVVKAEL